MKTADTDVKDTDSSTVDGTDVKFSNAFDGHADQLMNTLLAKESSTEQGEEEESAVLKKNATEEAVEEVAEEKTTEDETSVEEKDEKKPEGEAEEDEDAEEDSAAKESEAKPEKKHEEAVPYERFKEVNERAQRYEQTAKNHEAVEQFCQQNNISVAQYQDGLKLMALLNTNPGEAVKQLESIIQDVKMSTGQALPDDLQKELSEAEAEFQEGLLSQKRLDAIKSGIQERAKQRLNGRSSEAVAAQRAQQEQQQLTQSLSAWSAAKLKLDPDFKPKAKPTDPDGKFEDFLAKNLYLWTTNPPKNIQEAVALADKAYEQLQATVKRLTPKPMRKRVINSTGASTRSNGSDTPKSMDDVMAQVGRKHGYNI